MCLAGNDYVKYSLMRKLHEVENTEWIQVHREEPNTVIKEALL